MSLRICRMRNERSFRVLHSVDIRLSEFGDDRMRAVNIIRGAVGAALLVCGWMLAVYVFGAYGGPSWIAEALVRYLALGWLLMIPLGLFHALLALPGKTAWERRLKRAMVLKLLLIPFFAANFCLGFVGTIAFIFGGLILTFLALIIAWLALIATSADIIMALTAMRREGRLTTGEMAKHIILQLIYCADVIDAIVLWQNRDRYVPAGPGT